MNTNCDKCGEANPADTHTCGAGQAEPVQPVEVDQDTMELAESVGLIGPTSRTHELHAAIQRFHDLICANATIKAAKMAADAIRESTPTAAPSLSNEEVMALILENQNLRAEIKFGIAPVQPEHCGPSSSVFGLTEMILSDCGYSSNHQPLLNRVAARIQGYIDTPPAAAQPAKQESVGVVHHKPASVVGADYEQVAVFTRAVEWVGLTDGERNKIRFNYLDYDERARAIEAKLKEKNT